MIMRNENKIHLLMRRYEVFCLYYCDYNYNYNILLT